MNQILKLQRTFKMVSVIIPLYNSSESYIDCINSVLNQSIQPSELEVILVDDCSFDKDYIQNIPVLFEKKNISYKIIEHSENKGVGGARNTGIINSKGKYIALLDSDDIWKPDKLEKQLEVFKNNNDVVMVGTLSTMPESIIPPFKNKKVEGLYISIKHQLFKNYFQPSTVLIKNEVFNHFEWPIRRYAEEGDVFLRLYNYGKLFLINEILVDYSNGKKGFGISGLSSNIHKTQKEEINNIKNVYARNQISFITFMLAYIFSYIKYMRRIVIKLMAK